MSTTEQISPYPITLQESKASTDERDQRVESTRRQAQSNAKDSRVSKLLSNGLTPEQIVERKELMQHFLSGLKKPCQEVDLDFLNNSTE